MSHRLVSFFQKGAKENLYLLCLEGKAKPTTSINNNKRNARGRLFIRFCSGVAMRCFFFGGLKGYKMSSYCPISSYLKNFLLSACFDILFIFIRDNHAYFQFLKILKHSPFSVRFKCQGLS